MFCKICFHNHRNAKPKENEEAQYISMTLAKHGTQQLDKHKHLKYSKSLFKMEDVKEDSANLI